MVNFGQKKKTALKSHLFQNDLKKNGTTLISIKLIESMPERIQKYLWTFRVNRIVEFFVNKLLILKSVLKFCPLEKNDFDHKK